MTTFGQRLAQLSGLPLGSHTVAEHLRGIVARFSLPLVAPYTVAAVLIAYSGLPAGLHTVAEHLAVERAAASATAGGGGSVRPLRLAPRRHEVPLPVRARVHHDNEMFDAALMLILSGLLD